MSKDAPEELKTDASGRRFTVIAARYNPRMVERLIERCRATIEDAGGSVSLRRVPGSNELPWAASHAIRNEQPDVVVVLGLIIRGETAHHDVIAHGTAVALHQLAIQSGVPVINGIIVAENSGQAEARVFGEADRGREFGHAAIELSVFPSDKGG
jgi:6,7-dimethyl-8-ribityllumazine synthase